MASSFSVTEIDQEPALCDTQASHLLMILTHKKSELQQSCNCLGQANLRAAIKYSFSFPDKGLLYMYVHVLVTRNRKRASAV